MSFFSNRLRDARVRAGITQAELAKKLSVSTSTISMYECGNREPSIPMIDRICQCLSVSHDELFGTNAPPSGQSLKIALFGTEDISDEALSEVLTFADFVRRKHQ